MDSAAQFSRDLVLVGAGHTNLHIVRQWRMRPVPGVQLTLVSPFSRATYSGMLPGTLAGLYRPDEMQIDLYRFTAGTGIRLIVAEATGLVPDQRLITFGDRAPLRFDVASIGIGSVPSHAELWAHSSHVLSIKPMATFLARLEGAVARHAGSTQPLRCVIVGSGAAGTEVTFCLDRWLTRRGILHQLSLLDGNSEILPGYVPAFVRRVRQLLANRGVAVQLGQTVAAVSEPAEQGCAELRLSGGATLAADLIIWATSARPPAVLEQFQLPKTDGGFLAVRRTLQTTADAPVFAVGDTASFVDQRVPKAGVYAVREGPILWENLRNLLAGRPLVEYRPQRGFLSLLATGDGQALLQYKGWTQYGKWAWKLKDYIDRKFMRMYQDYQPPTMTRGTSRVTVMHCGGCGSKVGSELLSRVLRRIRADFPEITQALDAPDDAFVLASSAIRPDVFSVDYLRGFLDDPYSLGRIAVQHALSDMWAMGAMPLGVQAIITLPYGANSVQQELLFQLLSGAARELTTSRVELWGGHTIEGPELQLGFSVAGHLNGREPWRKSGLRPGDKLLLTKRLGTGTLLASHPRGLCRGEWFERMVAEMLVSNQPGGELAGRAGVRAATDITGFGLGGHLLEMLQASHCSAVVSGEALSGLLLPGFLQLAEQGLESTLAPANRRALRGYLAEEQAVSNEHIAALIDPQTAGGLLLGVPADQAIALLSALRTAGYVDAALLGDVRVAADRPMIVVNRSAISMPPQ
jgi:selenide,water dikinase